jgi:hypothetical protein
MNGVASYFWLTLYFFIYGRYEAAIELLTKENDFFFGVSYD